MACFVLCVLQKPNFVVAIKCITKKNLAKSQELLKEEIKILKVRCSSSKFIEFNRQKGKKLI